LREIAAGRVRFKTNIHEILKGIITDEAADEPFDDEDTK
jgi:hypothetical protein